MARLARSIRSLLPPSSTTRPSGVIAQPRRFSPSPRLLTESRDAPPNHFTPPAARTYMSEMRKSAFEGNILRLLRNEIEYELELRPPAQPLNKYGSFVVDDRPGEQWISLKRKHGDNEDITVEATMFDGAVPVSKAAVIAEESMQLHITMFVSISKGETGGVLEFVCSALPDTIEIQKLYTRPPKKVPGQVYLGPEFKELDDELQGMLYDYLEERGVSDELAGFLHGYMRNKDRTELIRWMGTLKTFIEKKQ